MSPGGSMGSRYVLQLLIVKSCKIANNSATTEAMEKMCAFLESLEFFDACLTKFENYQI
jgi:hypothetical protein